MNKKTKLIIGGLSIVALIYAYKKGLFGGKTSSAPSATDNTRVQLPSDAVTITPTGDPQGIIVMPNTFSQMAPISEGASA